MRKIIFLFSCLLVCLTAQAVRADGRWRSIRQPDGAALMVQLCGDEYLHYLRAADGRCFVRGNDGTLQTVNEGWLDEAENRASLTRAAANRNRISAANPSLYRGQHRQLLVLVSFSDVDFLQADAAARQLWDDIANAPGYTNNWGGPGSIRDYFLDQSMGLLDLTFDVVGPVKLSREAGYYGANSGSNDMLSRVNEMVRQACQALGPDVNADDYDWDGDGTVEQVIIVYAGEGEASGGDDNTVWPKQSQTTVSIGGRSSYVKYVVVNEACLLDDGTKDVMGIGTLCHEFSHCMGLPDLYDTYQNGNTINGGIVDMWDLMDGGNYSLNLSWTPTGYSAYERSFCGWLTPDVLTGPVTVEGLKTVQDGGKAYRIDNDVRDTSSEEYYIVENRQQDRWDMFLPGHGLVVTHVDYSASAWTGNSVNSNTSHWRLVPIPADGNLTSYYTDTIPLRHMAYPYVEDGIVMNDELTDSSTPAATVYNTNTSGTRFMQKPLTAIREQDGLVSFRFMGGSGDDIAQPVIGRTGSGDAYLPDGRRAQLRRLERGQLYIRNGKKYKVE